MPLVCECTFDRRCTSIKILWKCVCVSTQIRNTLEVQLFGNYHVAYLKPDMMRKYSIQLRSVETHWISPTLQKRSIMLLNRAWCSLKWKSNWNVHWGCVSICPYLMASYKVFPLYTPERKYNSFDRFYTTTNIILKYFVSEVVKLLQRKKRG